MTIVYTNDFDAETTGSLPTGWSNASGSSTVTATSPVKGTKSFGNAGTTDGLICVYNNQSSLTDQDVTLITRIEAISGANIQCAQPIARSNVSTTQHYLALINTTQVAIYSNNSGYTLLSSGNHGLTLSVSTLLRIRLQCTGTTIQARAWIDGNAEPSTWAISLTNSSFTAGRQGLRFGNTGGATQALADEFVVNDLITATVPGAPTIGAATAGNASASVTFTAPGSNGGSAITGYTATSSPGGLTGTVAGAGSGTITVAGLTNGTAYTFTVTAQNGIGSSAASAASNSVTPANSPTAPTAPVIGVATAGNTQATVTFTAPASNGGSAITGYTATSAPGGFTGTLAGATPGSITVTGLTNGTAYTFTVTATNAIGTSAASAASNSVTPAAAPVTVSVTDPALYFSPYNWFSDGTGSMLATNIRTGSTFAWSGMRGSYLKFRATVAASGSVSLNIDTTTLSAIAAAGCPQISWSVNGAALQSSTLTTGQTTLSLATGLAAGTYEVFVYFRGVYVTQDGGGAQNYTAANNIFKISSVVISAGGSVSATTIRPKKIVCYGDSITEGDLSNGGPRSATSQDAHYTYGFILSEALNAEVGIIGFYGQTWSWFNTTWPNHASGTSRLIGGLLSPAPDFITINYGENDGNPGPASATVAATLSAVSTAAPSAKGVLMIPFSGKARTNLAAATLPSNFVRVDLNRYEMTTGFLQWSYDGIHPNQRGNANLGALLVSAINAASVGTVARTVTATLTTDGTTPAANLTGLLWAFFDNALPSTLATPVSSGIGATTNASGVFSLAVNTTLAAAGVGFLVINNTDGATTTAFKGYAGPAAVS